MRVAMAGRGLQQNVEPQGAANLIPRESGGAASVSISVILPHYRCEAYLADAVWSILEQSWRDLELIVVDDASASDSWLDAIRPFGADKRLRVYRTRKNVGRFRILNKILELTDSPLVAFQDADDVSDGSRLEKQARV